MITRYISIALVLMLAAAVLTNCNTSRRLDQSKLEMAETRERYAEAARVAEAAIRNAERTHTEEISAIQQKADHEKSVLVADVARLTDSLRNRPERPSAGSPVPTSPADKVGCTGADIYRSDAEFLVRETARAESIRLQLASCQAAYDSAVKLTNP